MILIGVSGKKRHGKDTFFTAVESIQPGVRRLAFADSLKQEVATACGVTVETIEANKSVFRLMLQAWGEWRRNFCGSSYWIDRAKDSLASLPQVEAVIFTDVRFPNEAEFIVANGGSLVRVIRPSEVSSDVHPSEVSMDNYPFEHILINRDLVDFERQCQEWWLGNLMQGFQLV